MGYPVDPDYSFLYSENGTLNVFSYNTAMDFDPTKGTGINEWYLQQGRMIFPPNSQERIDHYRSWQDYLMDKICPVLPTLSSSSFSANWNNLENYHYNKSLLKNWGDLEWDGLHTGQNNTDELVLSSWEWDDDHNPLTMNISEHSSFPDKCLEPLFCMDDDRTIWPQLAQSFTYLNATTLEITTREGIYWQNYSTFTKEPFTSDDVYFSLYAWKYLSQDQDRYTWIKDFQKISDNQLIIYIDEDNTTTENEPYHESLVSLTDEIFPEHFLNQTQLGDGVTPDMSHSSWDEFSDYCFGTGLFNISSNVPGIEAKFTVRPDCWWLDPAVNKDGMNFAERFGDFSDGYIPHLKLRIYGSDLMDAFDNGSLDLVTRSSYYIDEKIQYENDPTKDVQTKLEDSFMFFAFNMRESRPRIGDSSPCKSDPTISKGLAIRKAISHALNKTDMSKQYHSGAYTPNYWPMGETIGIWRNPDITKYDFDLDQAKYFMQLAGYPESTDDLSSLNIIGGLISLLSIGLVFIAVIMFLKINKKRGVEN